MLLVVLGPASTSASATGRTSGSTCRAGSAPSTPPAARGRGGARGLRGDHRRDHRGHPRPRRLARGRRARHLPDRHRRARPAAGGRRRRPGPEIIGTTAQLTFRPVEEVIPPGDEGYDEGPGLPRAPVDERPELADDEGASCAARETTTRSSTPRRRAAADKYRGRPGGADRRPHRRRLPVQLGRRAGFSVGLDLDARARGVRRRSPPTSPASATRASRGCFAIVLDGVVESAPG
jgi:hypothetical protein